MMILNCTDCQWLTTYFSSDWTTDGHHPLNHTNSLANRCSITALTCGKDILARPIFFLRLHPSEEDSPQLDAHPVSCSERFVRVTADCHSDFATIMQLLLTNCVCCGTVWPLGGNTGTKRHEFTVNCVLLGSRWVIKLICYCCGTVLSIRNVTDET